MYPIAHSTLLPYPDGPPPPKRLHRQISVFSPPNPAPCPSTTTATETDAGNDQEFGRVSPAASGRLKTHRVCSLWACFGWRGDYATTRGGACCGCLDVPPQCVVGAWRSLDLVLVLVVFGCAIATGLVDGFTRVVVHAIQVGGEF